MTNKKPNIEDNILLKWAIHGSRELLNQIYSDDQFYSTAKYAHISENDAKKMVIYGFTRMLTPKNWTVE